MTKKKPEKEAATLTGWMGTRQVQEHFSISHMTIERYLKPEGGDPDFPRPVLMGRNRKFRVSDVRKYEHVLVQRALRKAQQQAPRKAR
jgi:predicted DNA-binding transcriptional regulator AlpA